MSDCYFGVDVKQQESLRHLSDCHFRCWQINIRNTLQESLATGPKARGKRLHQKSQKWDSIGEFQWVSIGNVQATSTGEMAILLTMPPTSEIMLEATSDNRMENPAENPRWYPRRRFLFCEQASLPPEGARGEPAAGLPCGVALGTLYITTMITIYSVCIYMHI